MKAQFKPRVNLEGRTPLQDVIPLDTPFVVLVDPASSCNFQCSFCPTGHRDLIADSGRAQGVLHWDLFTKIVDDLAAFDRPLKVLRLHKDGEPFLNKRLADMIAYAKKSGYVESVDTTTNGSLLTPARLSEVLAAGLNRINISVNGMTRDQYRQVTGVELDFAAFSETVRWLYANKGSCEVVLKIPGDFLTGPQKEEFLATFGDHCDRIFIDNLVPSWPEFDFEAHTGIKATASVFQQPINPADTCPYIFYSMAVNSDGLVSACCVDWGRKLVAGDVKTQSLKDIWHSEALNALRRQHLEGRRTENSVCRDCGYLSHCIPDNIDAYRQQILPKFLEYAGDISVTPPGTTGDDPRGVRS